jgi:hypothetical protein
MSDHKAAHHEEQVDGDHGVVQKAAPADAVFRVHQEHHHRGDATQPVEGLELLSPHGGIFAA